MKVLIEHPDGTKTVLYEPGDRVRLTREVDKIFGKVGECGTVIRRSGSKEGFESIAFIDVQTDRMKAGGWGTIHCAPWDVEAVGADSGGR